MLGQGSSRRRSGELRRQPGGVEDTAAATADGGAAREAIEADQGCSGSRGKDAPHAATAENTPTTGGGGINCIDHRKRMGEEGRAMATPE